MKPTAKKALQLSLIAPLAFSLFTFATPAQAMIFSTGNPAVLVVGMTVAMAGAFVFENNVAVMVGGLLGEESRSTKESDLAAALEAEIESGRMSAQEAEGLRIEIESLTSSGPIVISGADFEACRQELVASGFSARAATLIAQAALELRNQELQQ